MKIKRFFASEMRQAIGMVRDELGPDAVILSNQRSEGGVEIVAAVDYDQTLLNRATGINAGRSRGVRERPAAFERDDPVNASATDSHHDAPPAPGPAEDATTDEGQSDIVWSQDPAIVAMRDELKHLRGLVEHQLSSLAWKDFNRRQPMRAELVRRLLNLGLQRKLACELAENLEGSNDLEQGWHQALARLAHRISVTDDDILSEGGVVALVGPTGVGKTTTVAKLAARFALREGQNAVGLVSTDSYRIGAQEQLLTFGRILGVPVHNVADGDELKACLEGMPDKRLVVIDTAGMGQRDLRLAEQFAALRNGGAGIRTYLVTAANTQPRALSEVVKKFQGADLRGCILTKVDEATSLGEALSVLVSQAVPVAYMGDGQRVPEDLHPARAHNLVSRAVALVERGIGASTDASAADSVQGKVANADV